MVKLFKAGLLKTSQAGGMVKPVICILAPTNVLAAQLNDQLVKFFKAVREGSTSYMPSCMTSVLVAGLITPERSNVKTLKRLQPVCMVATPGRLQHMLRRNVVSFEELKMIIYDEADQFITENHDVRPGPSSGEMQASSKPLSVLLRIATYDGFGCLRCKFATSLKTLGY